MKVETGRFSRKIRMTQQTIKRMQQTVIILKNVIIMLVKMSKHIQNTLQPEEISQHGSLKDLK